MTSSKHFALYATTHRRGQPTEHRLAGARLGQVGVMLRWRLPIGWRATIYIGRAAIEATLGLPQRDPRFEEWLDVAWPRASRSFR